MKLAEKYTIPLIIAAFGLFGLIYLNSFFTEFGNALLLTLCVLPIFISIFAWNAFLLKAARALGGVSAVAAILTFLYLWVARTALTLSGVGAVSGNTIASTHGIYSVIYTLCFICVPLSSLLCSIFLLRDSNKYVLPAAQEEKVFVEVPAAKVTEVVPREAEAAGNDAEEESFVRDAPRASRIALRADSVAVMTGKIAVNVQPFSKNKDVAAPLTGSEEKPDIAAVQIAELEEDLPDIAAANSEEIPQAIHEKQPEALQKQPEPSKDLPDIAAANTEEIQQAIHEKQPEHSKDLPDIAAANSEEITQAIHEKQPEGLQNQPAAPEAPAAYDEMAASLKNTDGLSDEEISSEAQAVYHDKLEYFKHNDFRVLNDSVEARIFAQAVMANQLKYPATAVFTDIDEMLVEGGANGVYSVEGRLESQNAYGAFVSTGYSLCVKKENGQWMLAENNAGEKNPDEKKSGGKYMFLILGIAAAVIMVYFYFQYS